MNRQNLPVQRVKALDSLRGIAAAIVVLSHICESLITGHPLYEFTPLFLLRASHEAVIFFFLLSGYVLTLQTLKHPFEYKTFMIQRFCRIYIPYLVVIVSTFLLYSFFHDLNKNTKEALWLGSKWHTSLSLKTVINHLFLIGNYRTSDYNPVIWSLIHEMRISIIFPVILFMVNLKWKRSLLTVSVISLIAGGLIVADVNHSLGFNTSYIYTLHFISIFVIGGLVAKYQKELISYQQKMRSAKKVGLLITSLVIINYTRMLYLIPHKLKLYKLSNYNEVLSDLIIAISAGYLIICAVQIVNKRNLLLTELPLTLGKISYSLYLIHVPVMLVCFNVFIDTPVAGIIAISLVLMTVVAIVTNKYVEQPSAKIGKLICERLKGKKQMEFVPVMETSVRVKRWYRPEMIDKYLN